MHTCSVVSMFVCWALSLYLYEFVCSYVVRQINVASSQQISKRILPALITLSNDIDKMVRFHGVAPLGSVAMNAAEDEVSTPSNLSLHPFV